MQKFLIGIIVLLAAIPFIFCSKANAEVSSSCYFEKVCYYPDLTIPCALTEEELNKGLKGNFEGKAALFLEAEKETGVNAVFIASLGAIESGWGKYPNSKNNYFGWGGKTYYENPDDSILDISSKISKMYLSEDGSYFEGYTLEDVNIHYNGRQEWVDLISSMMAQISDDVLC